MHGAMERANSAQPLRLAYVQQGGMNPSEGSPMLTSPVPGSDHNSAQQTLQLCQSRLAECVPAYQEEVRASFHVWLCASRYNAVGWRIVLKNSYVNSTVLRMAQGEVKLPQRHCQQAH